MVRGRLGFPRLPNRFTGDGLMPWLAGPGLKTRYLLNGTLDPVLRSEIRDLKITRYDAEGNVADCATVALGNNRISVFDLPPGTDTSIHVGYCLLELANGRRLYHQHHLQILGPDTLATTHGRPKGVFSFGPRRPWAEAIVGAIDPMPYSWMSSVLPGTHARQYIVAMNVSDRDCSLQLRGGTKPIDVDMPPFGSRLLPIEVRGDEEFVTFRASAPFSFYVAMSRENNTGWTLQHIKQEF